MTPTCAGKTRWWRAGMTTLSLKKNAAERPNPMPKRAMLKGEVESIRVPKACLDVLAQQVVACVAVDAWDVRDLLALVRGSYPFRDLTAAAFESVLKLVSGRFHLETFRDLRPRISWD